MKPFNWIDSIPPIYRALLSAVLLYCSFYPLNIGWLGFVAIIPLVSIIHSPDHDRNGKKYRIGPYWSSYLAGLAFCLAAFRWIPYASTPMYAVWAVLSLIVALQFPLFIYYSRWFIKYRGHLPGWIQWFADGSEAAMVWMALEYLRAHIYIGFPWYYLGHTQHDFPAFIQLADSLGVYGVSFMVAYTNTALYAILRLLTVRGDAGMTKVDTWGRYLGIGVLSLLLWGWTLWDGYTSLRDTPLHIKPSDFTVAVLQGNQPQYLRNNDRDWEKLDKEYYELARKVLPSKPDLIIMPETCLSHGWVAIDPDANPNEIEMKYHAAASSRKQMMQDMLADWQTAVLIGLNKRFVRNKSIKLTNAALLFDKHGEVVGQYDKIVCLPFGEYIPLVDTLPFMKMLSPYPEEYTVKPGESLTAFKFKDKTFATLICYEDTLPHLARDFMRKEKPDFFVNISNDGWFKGTEEHEQHLVTAKFRCVETRRAMVRSVNMGVSCVIDSTGKVIQMPEGATSYSSAKNRDGYFVSTIPLDDRQSTYMKWGDWFPILAWVSILLQGFSNWLQGRMLKRLKKQAS